MPLGQAFVRYALVTYQAKSTPPASDADVVIDALRLLARGVVHPFFAHALAIAPYFARKCVKHPAGHPFAKSGLRHIKLGHQRPLTHPHESWLFSTMAQDTLDVVFDRRLNYATSADAGKRIRWAMHELGHLFDHTWSLWPNRPWGAHSLLPSSTPHDEVRADDFAIDLIGYLNGLVPAGTPMAPFPMP